MPNQTTGQLGEAKAANFLEQQGFEVLERNYRCRFGEADLVVSDGKGLIMVEVKTRTSARFGLPAEAINRAKLRRMMKVAESFRLERQIVAPINLGVVTILGDGEPVLITGVEAVD